MLSDGQLAMMLHISIQRQSQWIDTKVAEFRRPHIAGPVAPVETDE